MATGCIVTDLENLKSEYNAKINRMSLKFRSGEYSQKTSKKMAEILASYMSSLDELICIQNRAHFDSKYGEYKNHIMRKYVGNF